MMNDLIILTVEWPYGKCETFFENEAPYARNFDHIYCMPLYRDESKRSVPDSISIIEKELPSMFRSALETFIHKDFWNEVIELLKTKRFSFHNLKVLTVTSIDAIQRYKMLLSFIKTITSSDITVYSYWMASDAVAVAWLKKRCNVSFITRCHRFDLYEHDSTGDYIPYRHLVFNKVDKIFSISIDGKKYLSKTYSYLEPDKICVSKLGTNDWGVSPKGDSDREHITVVSCSNLIPVKRVDRMIDSLMQSKTKINWVHFGDGIMRDNLEEKIKALPSNVSFTFMGAVKNNELMNWYANNHVDLFVNFSSSEGIPVSIMEAMSFGIPVIATDVGGTSEIVVDGVNGFLLNPDCTDCELLKKINEVTADKNFNQLGKNAREYWLTNYYSKTNYTHFYNMIGKQKIYE